MVSIDPTRDRSGRGQRSATYVKRYGRPETANGWHFLTGTQPNIDALTRAVGFGYVKIPWPGRQADTVCARKLDSDRHA